MKIRLNIIFLVWAALNLLLTPALAVMEQYGLPPFDLDSGGRPLALSNAFTGVIDDVNAAFYNPGALPWAKGITLTLKDLSNITAGEAYPSGQGVTWGLAMVQRGLKNIPSLSGSTADFSSSILLLSAGSRSLPFSPSNLGLGLNLKMILGQSLRSAGVVDRTATGLELDLGLAYRVNPWLDLGVSGQNILPASAGGKLTWNNGEAESAPARMRTGFSAKIFGDKRSPVYTENKELRLTSDYDLSPAYPGLFSLGLEWGLRGALFLRAGLGQREKNGGVASRVSYGVGLRTGGWGADLTSYIDQFTQSNGIYLSVLYFPEEWVFEKRPEVITYPPITNLSEPVLLSEPLNDLSTYDDRIWVRGKAKPGVEVFINNQRAYVDEQMKFETLVPLNLGKNLIIIDSFFEGGKISAEKKVVRKARVLIAEEEELKKQYYQTRDKKTEARLKSEMEAFTQRRERVETLVTMGVVDVAPEQKFSLEAPVTRGELISWLVKAANLPLTPVNRDLFIDVPKDHPQAAFIKAGADAGIIKGFADGTFRPNDPVTESEGEKIFKKFGVIR